ncbi:hypothetical protein [Thermococcus sp.]|uniref:hypothetical protein n=1 Tax=Thermococcus sp. TaxID=35749 RepID=UPI0026263B2D|nr:hypothetical protein [Thermococcus sp.]
MEGIKEALESVEKKLIASWHIYIAIIYTAWLIAMGGYLTLSALGLERLTIFYWPTVFIGVVYVMGVAWKKFIQLNPEIHKDSSFRGWMWLSGWIVGVIIWAFFRDVRGFAAIIGLGNLGMAFSFSQWSMAIPAITLAAFLKPDWTFVNALIILSYSLVSFIHLWRTFKVV